MKRISMFIRKVRYGIEKMRIRKALRKIEKRKNAVLRQLEQNGYSS